MCFSCKTIYSECHNLKLFNTLTNQTKRPKPNWPQYCRTLRLFTLFFFPSSSASASSLVAASKQWEKYGVLLLSGSRPLCFPLHPLSMADVSPLSLSLSLSLDPFVYFYFIFSSWRSDYFPVELFVFLHLGFSFVFVFSLRDT